MRWNRIKKNYLISYLKKKVSQVISVVMTVVSQVMTVGNVGVHPFFQLLLIFPSDLVCFSASHWYCIVFLINSFFFFKLLQPESALCFHRGIVQHLQMIKPKLRKSHDIFHTVKKLVNLENWDSSLTLKPYTSDWDLNPLAGTQTQPKPCFGLEPTCLGLKSSQNPWCLVSGPNEGQVLDVSSLKDLSERQSDR